MVTKKCGKKIKSKGQDTFEGKIDFYNSTILCQMARYD